MDVDYTMTVLRKDKKLDINQLRELTQEELVDKVLQLQAHNEQLRNIITKQNSRSLVSTGIRKKKDFDFSKCKRVHVFFKLLYFGWDYQGFAVQEDTSATIEQKLMDALLKCKLIENRETSNYHRCGRTDKGVSAFSQVISITVRAADEGKRPLEYCKMLNRLLPVDIRITAWQPVPDKCSARFDCKSRTYKYFFPIADLDLEAMNEGAKHLIGTFDFRNLCKMDVGNGVTNFIRTVSTTSVMKLNDSCFSGTGYEMCVFSITAQSFLWHQVRCIVAVLLLIGKKLEQPCVIKELLNVQKNPRKPQYSLANDIALNLFGTEFDTDNWIIDEPEISLVIETLQKNWALNAIKSCHIKHCISELENFISGPVLKQASILLKKDSKTYKPLLMRNVCNSLEERISHFIKKRRIQIGKS